MPEAHTKVRLESDAPQINETCPVSGNIFQAGDDVVICQQSGVAFSAKHWAEAVSIWSGTCPYCDLPLETSVTQVSSTKAKKHITTDYTPAEFRQRSVSIPVWILGVVGAVILITLGLLIGLLWPSSVNDPKETGVSTPEEQLVSRNSDQDASSGGVIEPEATPTHTPTRLASKTPTPTEATAHMQPPPTKTRRPTATRTPRATATPKTPQTTLVTRCEKTAKGEFANLWRTYQQQLGCPRHSEPAYGQYAEMPFEKGHIFWIGNIDIFGDTRQVIATFGGQNEGDTGTWSVHQDTWNGQGICGVPAPPSGLHLPDRGIAKVWCDINGFEKLGYATAPQEFVPNRGIDAMQNFENGVVFRDSDGHSKGLTYVLLWNSMIYLRVRY